LRDALKRLGGAKGIDVVYDPVGGDLAEPALRSLGWLGRYLVVGFAAGEIPRVPFNLMLLKGIDVQGVFWGAFIARDPAAHAANQAQLLDWVAQGRLRAQAHGVYPLEAAAEALHALARREAKGKVLVRP
jgi:NADPH:quinone reductase